MTAHDPEARVAELEADLGDMQAVICALSGALKVYDDCGKCWSLRARDGYEGLSRDVRSTPYVQRAENLWHGMRAVVDAVSGFGDAGLLREWVSEQPSLLNVPAGRFLLQVADALEEWEAVRDGL